MKRPSASFPVMWANRSPSAFVFLRTTSTVAMASAGALEAERGVWAWERDFLRRDLTAFRPFESVDLKFFMSKREKKKERRDEERCAE